jgi:hypothetical protein
MASSKEVAIAAVRMSVSDDREEEKRLKAQYQDQGILVTAVDFGGDFISSINKMIERAIVAAKREGLINDSHSEEGSIAGATREAIAEIMPKAIGLNVGGKIGIARHEVHISVAIFFGVGLLHLNEVAIGLGHRVI